MIGPFDVKNQLCMGFVDVKNQLCITSMDRDNFPDIMALAFKSYGYQKLFIIYKTFILTTLGKKESQ
jgi:hypothetical protein